MLKRNHYSALRVAAGVFAVAVCAAATSHAALITAVSESGTGLDPVPVQFTGQVFNHPNEGANFMVPFLNEDVPAYTDRNHEYNGQTAATSIPALGLAGAEYVMIANDNRGVADYRLNVTVSQTVDVYVFMDTRVPQPAWLTANGYFDIQKDLGIDEGGDGVGPGAGLNNAFNIWWKPNVPAGTFTTFERGGTGNNMYGVAVLPPGVGPTLQPPDPPVPFTPGNFGMIDLGATGGRPEPGALPDVSGNTQIGAAANGVNATNMPAREMISPLDPSFHIEIDNLDETGTAVGNLDWRDRGDSVFADPPFNQPLIKLGEDFLKNNAGVIHVTLSNLVPGLYTVTSFHVDPQFSQSERIKILVDNGNGLGYVDTGVIGNASNPGGDPGSAVGVLSTAHVLGKGATFQFITNGLNDVQILFDGRMAADTEVPLAGLNISHTIPEPISLGLIGMGVLAIRARRRG